jgi:2-polyprenyl-3-methyl-5-hydroxy-6-metoxy-1,4-benzoquinol methylase
MVVAVKTKMYSVDDCKKCWDDNAEYWSAELNKGNDIVRDAFMLPAFLKNIPTIIGKKVLDVGCGDGNIPRLLAQEGAYVTGVDFSTNMIESAKRMSDHCNIDYLTCSATELSGFFSENQFDLVISFMVLCSVKDISSFFRQAHKVLNDDGELYFLTAHPCFRQRKTNYVENCGILITDYFNKKENRIKWDFGKFERDMMEDIRYPWNLGDYVNGVADAGFTIKKIIEPKPSRTAIGRLPSLKKWTHAAHSLIVLAGKK